MGIPVLILGASGSGKSASMRNFKEHECCVLNVAGKPLPFKGKLDTINNATYTSIGKAMKEAKFKTYVVDDSQYLLAFELFDRAKETGYAKFTDIAVRFRNMVSYVAQHMPDDRIVYFLHHTDMDNAGRIKAKTVGKMLDNQLTVEGLFSIVLINDSSNGGYHFVTNNEGESPAKSPIGMFEREIDNDLKMVDATIRKYYEI